MTSYDDLPIIPAIVAEEVLERPYAGNELQSRFSDSEIKMIEKRRQNLSFEDKQKFITICDQKCRAAYEQKADWFLKCVNSKSSQGRDQLYVWFTHWMVSYLKDKGRFLQSN